MYSEMFGFTEDEVQELVKLAERPELMDSLRRWYNGYVFGNRVIYNPWSIVNYLYAPADGLRAYWVNTSSNTMIRDYVLKNANDLKSEFEQLLHGEELNKPIYENISMPDLQSNGDMVWSLLLFAGYLKPTAIWFHERRPWARLVVPNEEVYVCLADLTQSWFNELVVGTSSQVQRLLKAMLRGEEREMHYILQNILKNNVSFHDTQERFFHGLVLGLLVNLSDSHDVHSNRESGFGRCDVIVNPKQPGKPGVVLEFKMVDTERGETMEQALASAMQQLRERDYASSIRERQASPIHWIAVAFEGKKVQLKVEYEP